MYSRSSLAAAYSRTMKNPRSRSDVTGCLVYHYYPLLFEYPYLFARLHSCSFRHIQFFLTHCFILQYYFQWFSMNSFLLTHELSSCDVSSAAGLLLYVFISQDRILPLLDSCRFSVDTNPKKFTTTTLFWFQWKGSGLVKDIADCNNLACE